MRLRLAVLGLLLSASVAHADPEGEAAFRGFLSRIDALPDWSASAGTVRSEGSDIIAEAVRIAQEDGAAITLDFARLGELRPAAEDGYAAAEIEIRGARAEFTNFEMTLPALAARGLSLPDPATLMVDPDNPVHSVAALYSSLARSELAAAQIPSVDIVQTTPGPGEAQPLISRIRYENFRLENMQNGAVASLAFGPVSARTEGSATSRFEVREGSIETLNIASLAYVFDERNYAGSFGDGIWRPVLGRVLYSGISGGAEAEATFNIGEISVQNVEARQPPRPFTERLQTLSTAEDASDDPEAARLAIDTLGDMFSAFRLGSMVMRDLEVTPPEATEGDKATVAAITLDNLSSDGFDVFSIRNAAVQAEGGFARLAGLEVTGLEFPEAAAFLDLLSISEDDTDPAARTDAIRAALNALPRLSRFSMNGMAGGLAGTDPVTLDRVDVSLEKYSGPFPTISRLLVEGLNVPEALLDLDPRAAELMNKLGYRDLTIGLEAEEIWTPQEGRSATNLGFDVKDAFAVDVDYSHTGVTEDWIVSAIAASAEAGDSDTAAMLAVLDGLFLESGAITFTDHSIVDRALGLAAEKQGLTVDGATYRQQLRGALPFLLSTIIDADLAKLLTTPLQDFLGGGKSLVIEAKPTAPVPLSAVAETAETEPKALVGLLGATARAEPVQ